MTCIAVKNRHSLNAAITRQGLVGNLAHMWRQLDADHGVSACTNRHHAQQAGAGAYIKDGDLQILSAAFTCSGKFMHSRAPASSGRPCVLPQRV